MEQYLYSPTFLHGVDKKNFAFMFFQQQIYVFFFKASENISHHKNQMDKVFQVNLSEVFSTSLFQAACWWFVSKNVQKSDKSLWCGKLQDSTLVK